jgi:hypothetical protein
MGIVKRQPGEAKVTAKAGEIIGKAAKEKQAEEEARRQQELSFKQAAQQRAMEWEIEKMTLRSQQDFQRELRAKQWDLEKLEIRSRLDFEQEEKKRQERIDNANTKILAIDKAEESGKHSKEALAPYRAQAEMSLDIAKAGGTGTAPLIRPEKPVRPPSARSQVGEIEAGFELEGYTPQDLIDIGLNPTDFPGVGSIEQSIFGEEAPERPISEYSSPTTQAEYDVIPRGTDYIDSKGNIRTKR